MSINENPAPEHYLTVAEVATIMHVSKMTVYRLVHSGEIEAIRLGRSFRISEVALNQYLRDAFLGSEKSKDSRVSVPSGSSVSKMPRASNVPIRIYLAVGDGHVSVESAVLGLLDIYGFEVGRSKMPVTGSWFRELWARAKDSTPSAEDQLIKLQRAIELQGLDRPQSQVDLNQAEAVSRLLASLDPESDALIQIGSVFLVKVDRKVIVRNLTQIELAYFHRNPALFEEPGKALQILQQGWPAQPPSVASGG